MHPMHPAQGCLTLVKEVERSAYTFWDWTKAFSQKYTNLMSSGYVSKDADIGLAEGTPVYAGGGDAVIQTTGMGIVKRRDDWHNHSTLRYCIYVAG